MKKTRSGRPKGAKNGTHSNRTRIVSFRLPDVSLVNLDKIRDKINEMCGINISRSFMLEMILAEECDIDKYRKFFINDE